MAYRVRDWINTRLRPIPNSLAFDYDGDAIRLLLDELGERYKRENPALAAKVARLKAGPRKTFIRNDRKLCKNGHDDWQWVRRKNGEKKFRMCRTCAHVRYAAQNKKRRTK